METYKIFKPSVKIEQLTAEDIAEIRQRVEQMDNFNRELQTRYRQDRLEMLKKAACIWPQSSKAFKAIQRQIIPDLPDNMREFRKLERRYQKYADKKTERAKLYVYRQHRKERQQEAVEILEAMGFIHGEDFRTSNAISFLKNHEEIPEPAFPMTDRL